MKAKKCWKAHNKQYGYNIDGYRPLYTDSFLWDYSKKKPDLVEAYLFHRELSKRYEGKKDNWGYCPDHTRKNNSLYCTLAKDLAHGMKPIIQGIIAMGYEVGEYLTGGQLSFYFEQDPPPGYDHWNIRIELHFTKNYLTIGRVKYNKDRKNFFIDGNLPIEQYLSRLHQILKNQFTNDGFFGQTRKLHKVALYELIELYKANQEIIKRQEENYTAWSDWQMIENHLLKRLRKKNNIILVNEDKIETEYPRLSKKRYKKLTKINTRASYITYSDLEAEASMQGEELDDTNLEEIFYSVCEDLNC